ncbi:MAG: hypothetical protein ABJF88_15385 [Rhodothermales bacterium]
MKKLYTAPQLSDFGSISQLTADSRENSTADTFYTVNGTQPGLGGSLDGCVFFPQGHPQAGECQNPDAP